MRYRELVARGLSGHDEGSDTVPARRTVAAAGGIADHDTARSNGASRPAPAPTLRDAVSRAALTETGGQFGEALLLCALTTLVGFYAFIPTSYRGVAELGVIAGTGILIGLFTSLTLLPALIEKWPPKPDSTRPLPMPALVTWFGALPVRHRQPVRLAAALLALAGLVALPFVRFDYNPMHLKPPHTESLAVYEDLMAGPDSPLSATVLAKSPQEAADISRTLQALPVVGRVLSLHSFVPQDQPEKLATLESLNLSLGLGVPEQLQLKPVDFARDRAAMQSLSSAARAYQGKPEDRAAALKLADTIDTFLLGSAKASPQDQTQQLTLLRDALLGSMPKLLQRLHRALDARAVTLADLPEDLRHQWVSADGQYRVEAAPKENLNEDEALIRFADAVQAAVPQATGAPIAYVAGARTVMGAFAQAFISAFVLIVILLLVLLRSIKDTLRALVPLVLGSLLLAGVSVLIGLRLNFANVIALPLLLGIGVDIGVVILWRARHAGANEPNPVMTSTGAAVAVSALTTLTSFASLMLSVHRGMSSMGLLLTLGLLLYLACTFIVLPSLLPARTSNPAP